MSDASGAPPLADQLLAMASGAWVTQMIHVAAELGLADLLAEGPKDVDNLADSAGAHPDSLFRLMRGLASLGLFQETEPQRFLLHPWQSSCAATIPNPCDSSHGCWEMSII